jgi:hypothetical protein
MLNKSGEHQESDKLLTSAGCSIRRHSTIDTSYSEVRLYNQGKFILVHTDVPVVELYCPGEQSI